MPGCCSGACRGLQLDRTGVALLGAILLVAAEAVPLDAAVAAVDGPTMALLFGFMVLSAQLRQSGFFARATWWLASRDTGPAMLLGALVFGAGALSAVFSNDIVCLAATPVLRRPAAAAGWTRCLTWSAWPAPPTSARPPRWSAIRRTC
jgi:Na+/H+ antiporter NhaD/arsenite permease-like protein